jgi:hypothetical protein
MCGGQIKEEAMTNEITIAWMTSRRDACFDWFCDSLHRECGGQYDGLRVMAIDYWANPWIERIVPLNAASYNTELLQRHEDRRAYILNALRCPAELFQWSAPKPNAWQGPYRQTRADWFAAASARNTALALCKTDWIAYVDDLTCLAPGWLGEVFNGVRLERTITCGAYRKALEMVVVNGELIRADPNLGADGKTDVGLDNRVKHTREGAPQPCQGNWMYGCSLLAPVEAFLECNGWDERCDGMGSEDYCTGINLGKKGWKFRYAPKMMTVESEERHHSEPSFRRSDYGVSPDDKSHEMLRLSQSGNGWAPNDFGGQDLRKLRMRISEGQPFPVPPRDCREWYTKKLLSDL